MKNPYKLKKGESMFMTELVTLSLFGQDIWLQNVLFANKQRTFQGNV